MCGGTKTLKHNVRTTLPLAYHGCNNLSHTSKTRHVKRTLMVATVTSTIRVFVTFSERERNETVVRKDVRFKPEPCP